MKLLGAAIDTDFKRRGRQYYMALVIGNPHSSDLPCLDRVCPDGCVENIGIDFFARSLHYYGV